MARFWKLLAIMLSIIALTSVTFLLYAHFLVDYSLENLGLALEVTDQNPENVSPAHKRVYDNLVQDMVMDEVVQEEVDFKSLALLELVSRSFNEAVDKLGYPRAKIYLNQIIDSKKSERSPVLRVIDLLYYSFRQIQQFLSFVVNYIKRSLFGEKEEVAEMSKFLLLTQAEERENNSELEEAVKLYRQYLELYPGRSDTPFVTISLAHVLMKQKNWPEAEKLLNPIVWNSQGHKESAIASHLLKRMARLKSGVAQVEQLKQIIPAYEGTPMGEKMQFKLALRYLSIGSFVEAQQAFKKLQNAKDNRLSQKSKFYIAWIYKLQSHYEQGTQMMMTLLDEKEIDKELKLGLEAELADIYYQKGDIETSLAHYEALSEKARENLLEKKAASEAWIGLAEIEQGVIYHFNIGDQVKAQRFLTQAGEFIVAKPQLGVLRQKLEDVPYLGLRDLAFKQLQAGRVNVALTLFQRNLVFQPKDAWTHSGIGSIYILLADLRRAYDFADAGYRLLNDEYTSAILGYVFGFLEKYPQSIARYQESVGRNANYIPPRYNLACMYLKIKDYEKALDPLLFLEKTLASTNPKAALRAKVLNNLGYTFWWLGKHEEAMTRFHKALEVRPEFMDAKRNLEQISLGAGPQKVAEPQPL